MAFGSPWFSYRHLTLACLQKLLYFSKMTEDFSNENIWTTYLISHNIKIKAWSTDFLKKIAYLSLVIPGKIWTLLLENWAHLPPAKREVCCYHIENSTKHQQDEMLSLEKQAEILLYTDMLKSSKAVTGLNWSENEGCLLSWPNKPYKIMQTNNL